MWYGYEHSVYELEKEVNLIVFTLILIFPVDTGDSLNITFLDADPWLLRFHYKCIYSCS